MKIDSIFNSVPWVLDSLEFVREHAKLRLKLNNLLKNNCLPGEGYNIMDAYERPCFGTEVKTECKLPLF